MSCATRPAVTGRIGRRLSSLSRPAASRVGIVAAGLLVTLFTARLSAQSEAASDGLRFEDFLPSNCYLVVLFEGLHEAGQQVDGQTLFDIWDESEIQAFLDPALSQAIDRLEAARDESGPGGLPLTRMWQLFGGRLGVAAGGMTSVNSIPMPAMLAGLDVGSGQGGASTADVESFLEQWLDQLPGEVRDSFIRGTFDYRGFRVKTVGSAAEQWEVCYTSLGNLFVVGTSRYYLINYLENYLKRDRMLVGSVNGGGGSLGAGGLRNFGDAQGRLVDLPSYQRARQRLGEKTPILWAHLNLQAIKPILGIIPPLRGLMDFLGISGVNSLTLASHLEGSGSRELIYVDAPDERNGLVWLAEPGSVDMAEVGWAPPQSMIYTAIPCRFSEAYGEAAQGLKGVLFGLLPPDMRSRADQMLTQLLLWVPVNVMGDLLEPLGDTASFFVAPSAIGAPVPDLGMSVRVANPWRFETALTRLLSILPPDTLRMTRYGEHTIYYTSLRTPAGPMQMAFTMLSDRLLAATQVMSLEKLIQWAADDNRVILADTPDFQNSLATLGGGAGYLTYVNVPMLAAGWYRQFAPGLPSLIESQGLPLDSDYVPAVETIVSHLRGVMVSYSADQGGLLFEITSPIGVGSLVECSGALANWVFREGYGNAVAALANHWGGAPQSAQASIGAMPPTASQSRMPATGDVTRPVLPPGSQAARYLAGSSIQGLAGLSTRPSRVFDVRTDLAEDVTAPLIEEAEAAWEAACDLVGIPKLRGGGRSPTLVLLGDKTVYKSCGTQVAEHDDAVKSSTFPMFCSVDPESGMASGYVLRELNDGYTRCMVRHAAAELALRTHPRASVLPRWLIEGVACYVSRYSEAKLAAWSIDGLTKEGGPIALSSFFHPFTITRQTVLEAGLLVACLSSRQSSREVRYAWADVKNALTETGGDMSPVIGNLERLLDEHAYELDAYVESLLGDTAG